MNLLKSVSEQMGGRTLCALGDFAAAPPQGALRKFPEHFLAHVDGRCPSRNAAAGAGAPDQPIEARRA
jgi:hypothetical protein